MTADAKIGLLLALVFIVAITFVINGLPDFLSKDKVEQPTRTYVKDYPKRSPGVIGQSREGARHLYARRPSNASAVQTLKVTPVETYSATDSSLTTNRYDSISPEADDAVREMAAGDMATTTEVIDVEKTTVTNIAVVAEDETVSKPLKAKTYTVKSGDSLERISVKFYGNKIGRKLSSIKSIYRANSMTIEAMDKIVVGQELVIPYIQSAPKNIFVQNTIKKDEPKSVTVKGDYKTYVVRKNESLWKIAAAQLGDGKRYHEIIELNKDVLANPNNVRVGMELKLP